MYNTSPLALKNSWLPSAHLRKQKIQKHPIVIIRMTCLLVFYLWVVHKKKRKHRPWL